MPDKEKIMKINVKPHPALAFLKVKGQYAIISLYRIDILDRMGREGGKEKVVEWYHKFYIVKLLRLAPHLCHLFLIWLHFMW